MPEKVLASKSRLWYNEDRSGMDFADVAEWQTHQTQNLTGATSCGFKSHHPQVKFDGPQARYRVCGLFLSLYRSFTFKLRGVEMDLKVNRYN